MNKWLPLLQGVLLIASTPGGLAASAQWTSAGDGISWSDGANWNGGAPPNQGDDILIDTQPTTMPEVLGFDPTPAEFTVRSFTFGTGLTQGIEVWPLGPEVLRIGEGGVTNLSSHRHGFLVNVQAVSDSTWSLGSGGLSVSVFRPEAFNLTITGGVLALGTNTVFDINSATDAGSVFGAVEFQGALAISLNYLPDSDTEWQLIDSNEGDFSHFAIAGLVSSGDSVFENQIWTIEIDDYRFAFNEATGVFSFTVIPEPGSVLLLCGAGLGLLLHGRRKAPRRREPTA